MRAYTCLLLTALSTLGGCGSSVIFKHNNFSTKKPEVLSIDASQRVVLSNPAPVEPEKGQDTAGKSGTDRAQSRLRMCVEPAPDLFRTLASSLGAEISSTLSPDKSVSLAGKLATTLSENAATIERSQTVNVLREVMYRNCERWLSGGISDEEFIVQSARDQQLIIQVLAIEQITGPTRAQATALTTLARATTAGASDSMLEAYTAARTERDAKATALAKAKSEAADQAPKGACPAKPLDENTPPTGVSADDAKAKNARCAALASAGTAAQDAQEHFDTLQTALKSQATVSGEAQGKLALAAATNAEANKDIADIVLRIVQQYEKFDELKMLCVVKLRNGGSLEKELSNICLPHLQLLRLQSESEANSRAEARHLQNMSDRLAESVWNAIQRNNKVDPIKLDYLIDTAGPRLLLESETASLKKAKSMEQFLRAFKALDINTQKKLALIVSAI